MMKNKNIPFQLSAKQTRELANLRYSRDSHEQSCSPMDDEDVERLAELEALERMSQTTPLVNESKPRPTILELCQALDAAGGDEAERRKELLAQLRDRLGAAWAVFEGFPIDPKSSAAPATEALHHMILDASRAVWHRFHPNSAEGIAAARASARLLVLLTDAQVETLQ